MSKDPNKEPFDKTKYDIQYQKENIKRLVLGYQKSDYEKVKAAAEKSGETVSGFCKKAIQQRIDKEQ